MTDDDIPAFQARLVGLAELFLATLPSARQTRYFEALRDLSYHEFVRACEFAQSSCTFMPLPAELRALVRGDLATQIEYAWNLFRQAIRVIGAYASVIVEDPALAATMRLMYANWALACTEDLSPEMWASRRKEFGRIYSVAAQRGDACAGPTYFPGWCEARNAFLNQEPDRRFIPVGVIGVAQIRTNVPALERPRISAPSVPLTWPALPPMEAGERGANDDQ